MYIIYCWHISWLQKDSGTNNSTHSKWYGYLLNIFINWYGQTHQYTNGSFCNIMSIYKDASLYQWHVTSYQIWCGRFGTSRSFYLHCQSLLSQCYPSSWQSLSKNHIIFLNIERSTSEDVFSSAAEAEYRGIFSDCRTTIDI